jgi:ABC-type lipoprotein export system ATPase subunit
MKPTPHLDNSAVIRARDLTRIYTMGEQDVVGVTGIDLDISPGDLIVLKGKSGSGKSTLLSLLAGLDRPTSGSLNVAGHDLSAAPPEQMTRFRRNVIGMIFQSFNLMPTLTVLENVGLPGRLAGRPPRTVEAESARLLDWLGLSGRLGHLPSQLSGGEMQRTAIARALINDPAVVLADEPTGNLDSRNGRRVIELLSELNRQWGRTVIIATHSTMADPFASREICLTDGVITTSACGI